jgi:hypothetical protein
MPLMLSLTIFPQIPGWETRRDQQADSPALEVEEDFIKNTINDGYWSCSGTCIFGCVDTC